MRRLLLAAVLVVGLSAPASAAPITVGTGQNGDVAIADDGTAYVGWGVNVGDPGDAVAFCVLPATARACAVNLTLAFPGQGFGIGRVSVLLPAPGVVDVVVPREEQARYSVYLARSTDGGRTFAAPVRIGATRFEQAAAGPGGRVALVGGLALNANVVPADGSAGSTDGVALGEVLDGQFNDIATQGEEVIAAGSNAFHTRAYRLPAAAKADDPAAWQPLADPLGRQPELAGGPAGLAAMLEPSDRSPSGLFVQRLEGAAWSPPIVILPTSNNDFRLMQNARGRLTAVSTSFSVDRSRYELSYTTSTDGGVLWSSPATVADYGDEYVGALQVATAGDGRGVTIVDNSTSDHLVRVARFSPRSAPVALRRFGSARVQARAVCDRGAVRVVVEAARGARRTAPGSVLRRAIFGRARHARRTFAGRFAARYEVRRGTRVRVRLVPRRGRSRTLILPVRRC